MFMHVVCMLFDYTSYLFFLLPRIVRLLFCYIASLPFPTPVSFFFSGLLPAAACGKHLGDWDGGAGHRPYRRDLHP